LKIYKQFEQEGEFTWKEMQEPSHFADKSFSALEGGGR